MSQRALQECLAAEHAAVYGYGVVGGVLAGATAVTSPDRERAATAYVDHRRRRDTLTELLTGQGVTPVAAEPAYDVGGPVTSVGECRDLARRLEDRCAAVYADGVSRSIDDDRALAARGLMACALRAVEWGARPDAFPGLSEF